MKTPIPCGGRSTGRGVPVSSSVRLPPLRVRFTIADRPALAVDRCSERRPRCWWLLLACLLVASGLIGQQELVAGTVTFAAGEDATHPWLQSRERTAYELSVDLSALPPDATIFRAELVLASKERFGEPQLRPTVAYPTGHPETKLEFAAPRCVGLDVLAPLRSALAAGEPLRLRLESSVRGAERLEVSFVPDGAATERGRVAELAVRNVRALHRNGQTFVLFDEPSLAERPELATGEEVRAHREALQKLHPGLTFRIWRSLEPIDSRSIARAELVGECGTLTAWNDRYWQGDTPRRAPVRYRVLDGGEPLPWGTGVYAHNPSRAGRAYYAVTVAIDGREDFAALASPSCSAGPVDETVGLGEPVLQWIERPAPNEGWHYRRGELARLVYTRWESGPHSSTPNNPIDYLVAIPLTARPDRAPREAEQHAWRVEPAPVGLHLHCWGGSCNGGYGWWYNAHRGTVLIASNQIPYDWWTGYHESIGTRKSWGDGHVQPYTMRRMFAFLDWASTQWRDGPEAVRGLWPRLDLRRVFAAGNSMGGSGAPMFAIRHGERIAWGLGWVGVHVPELSPTFASSYRNSYGPRDPRITMPDGRTSPWDHFSDVWWLRHNVAVDTGMIIASNGKNDGGIGWQQAYLFARALQETRRPHIYNWGMGGHGTRTVIGANFDLDLRSDRSLPAFTNGSLDDDIGDGSPESGAATGQYNAHLWWDTDTVIDTPGSWEVTIRLRASAPRGEGTVDITPRRCQRFRSEPGTRWRWSNAAVASGETLQSGEVSADRWGLLTVPGVEVTKAPHRVVIRR